MNTMTEPGKEWSLAASARLGRNGRITAVRYMRRAKAERRWFAAMLAEGHETRAATAGDPDTARAVQFALMGYPAPDPADWNRASAMVLADEARILAEADLYVVTPQMLDVVLAAAQTLTYEDLQLLHPDDLPARSGAVVLPRPVVTRLPAGGVQEHIAFTWRWPSRIPLPPGLGFTGPELPAVRLSGYQTRARLSGELAAAVRAQGVEIPPMLLDSVWCLPFHAATAPQAHDQELLTGQLGRFNAAYWQQQTRDKAARAAPVGEYASGAALDDPQGTLASRFLYAFWRLCEQRIGTISTAEASPRGQATAARTRPPAEVRVVALRRASTAGQAGPHQWQHHWIVRMHKVRQWYPSLQQHKVIYRGPLVKGDKTKPLLGGETVRGLVR